MHIVLAIRQSMGSCWFSRNTNLLTRSGPEGSSHGRCRVCRDVAGKAPPNFCIAIPLFLSSYFLHRNRIVERLHLNIFLFTYCLINSFFNYIYSQYGFGELIRNRIPFTYYRLRVIDE